MCVDARRFALQGGALAGHGLRGQRSQRGEQAQAVSRRALSQGLQPSICQGGSVDVLEVSEGLALADVKDYAVRDEGEDDLGQGDAGGEMHGQRGQPGHDTPPS